MPDEVATKTDEERRVSRKSSSGPLLGQGETLVGVVDSLWPLSNPRGLLPGDVILRIGRRGQVGTLRAPFVDGLTTVRQSISSRAASDGMALLQVLRGSSKLELLVSLQKSTSSSDDSAGEDGSEGRNILGGVVLEEGKHSKFAPLAARTEHNILRLERMKAYGLPLDLISPPKERRAALQTLRNEQQHLSRALLLSEPCKEGDNGSKPGVKSGSRMGHSMDGLSNCKAMHELEIAVMDGSVVEGSTVTGALKDSSSDDEARTEEETESEDQGEEDGDEDDDEHFSYNGGFPEGSLLSVAASLLPSDPLLVDDDDDDQAVMILGADSFCRPSHPVFAAAALDDTSTSKDSVKQDSGARGFSSHSAPGTSVRAQPLFVAGSFCGAPLDSEKERQEKESGVLRMYTRPNSPLKKKAQNVSQLDLVSELAKQQHHPVTSAAAGAVASALPSFQIRRRSIPEATSAKAASVCSGPASLFTILVLPSESTTGNRKHCTSNKNSSSLHRRFSDVNHTVERATKWFSGVKSSGVALDLMSAQTEVLPLRLGGMDNEKLSKVAQYGKWIVKTGDRARGDHVSVLRAVRLWLVPVSEVELTLCMSTKDGICPDWGIQLSQTPQGIIHVLSVAPGSAADKAGVHMLLRMAEAKQQLLVVSKIQSHLLIPSMISDDGVDSVDVDAIHEQLILHAHLQSPLQVSFVL